MVTKEEHNRKKREYMRQWRRRNPEKVRLYNAQSAQWHKEHPDQVRAYSRKHEQRRTRNPEQQRAYWKKYREEHKEERAMHSKQYYETNADSLRTYASNWRKKLSEEVKALLGGTCACCGESVLEMLTIDHIKNDGGGMKRRHHQNVLTLIARRFKDADPIAIAEVRERYAALCWNCNMSKRHGGECVHRRPDGCTEDLKPRAAYMRKYIHSAKELLGGVCVCCGERQREFLALDHVRNDGHSEPKNKNGTRNAYTAVTEVRKAFASGDPEAIKSVRARLQVLCHNCNESKHYGGGTCFHRREVWNHPEYPYSGEKRQSMCG